MWMRWQCAPDVFSIFLVWNLCFHQFLSVGLSGVGEGDHHPLALALPPPPCNESVCAICITLDHDTADCPFAFKIDFEAGDLCLGHLLHQLAQFYPNLTPSTCASASCSDDIWCVRQVGLWCWFQVKWPESLLQLHIMVEELIPIVLN